VHDAFYRGEPAQIIVRFSRQHDGWLTTEDLAGFDGEIETALARRFHDWEVWTPTTWCQGPALLQALAIVELEPIERLGHNSAEYVHFIAEAIKLAFVDRERHYGDPRFTDVPLEQLLSTDHAEELHAQIDPANAHPGVGGAGGSRSGRFDTTYLCAIDADGNVFSAMPGRLANHSRARLDDFTARGAEPPRV
jgi:gamma-glutamyltranspeptidase/glutathione hydrolase